MFKDVVIKKVNVDTYRTFKMKCVERGITIGAGINEAMFQWIKNNE